MRNTIDKSGLGFASKVEEGLKGSRKRDIKSV
jgi:hypothetical protein